ncbi:MAG: LamG-like jellyroll fold domain-containing protein [Saprospiraceae bacterium]
MLMLILATTLVQAQEVTFDVDVASQFNHVIDKVTIKLKNVHSKKTVGNSSDIVKQFRLLYPIVDDAAEAAIINGVRDAGEVSNVVLEMNKQFEYEITVRKTGADTCLTTQNFYIEYAGQGNLVNPTSTSGNNLIFKGKFSPKFNDAKNNTLTGSDGSKVNAIRSNLFFIELLPEFKNDGTGANGCGDAFAVSINTATLGPKPVDVLGTAISPETPWVILHDPPGDGSYSYFEENKKICRQTTLEYDKGGEAGGYASAKIGAKGSVGGGFIVEASTDFEAYVETTASFNAGARKTGTKTYETCLDFSSRFQTSGFAPNSQAAITGENKDQDIFIGMGTVYKFGEFDDFIIDNGLNRVVAEKGLMFAPASFTQFIRTEESIKEDIIAQRAAHNNASLDGHTRAKALAQANAWEKILEQNNLNKQQAEVVPAFQNQAYDAGPTVDQKWTTTITETNAIETEIYFESKLAIDGKAEVAGSGVSAGGYVMGRTSRTQSNSGTSEDTQAIGYHLEDDDVGTDKFFIDVKKDKKYGTPVFELDPQSITSCPYEGGIKANQPDLTADDESGIPQEVVEYHTWPGNTISIPLNICNLSPLERKYEIKLNSGTNVNNAEIKLGGAILDSSNPASYTVAAKNGNTKSCFTNSGDKPKLLISQPANVANSGTEFKDITLSLYNCEKEFFDEIKISVYFDQLDPERDEDRDGIKNKDDNCPELAGRGFYFDGVDDNFEINSGLGNFKNDDFAFEMWLKVKTEDLPSMNNLRSILSKQSGCGTNSTNFWSLDINASSELVLSMVSLNVSPVSYNSVKSNARIGDGEWHHIAIARSNRRLTMYIDGNFDNSTFFNPSNLDNSDPLRIGGGSCDILSGNPNGFFKGEIDELRFYDHAIFGSQITTYMLKEIKSDFSNLVAYYNFEHGKVNQANTNVKTLTDQTGNNHNAVLHNALLLGSISNWTYGAKVSHYDGNGNGIGDICEQSTEGALALEWIDFNVYLNPQNASVVQWTVQAIENVSHFVVEYSTDAQQWQAIGEVMGKGEKHEVQTYQFVDTQPSKGINYYRIKEVEMDGKENLSNIKKLWLETAAVAMRVFPNPTTNELNITASDLTESATTLRLFDLVGKVVFQQHLNPNNTHLQTTINLSSLPTGIYTLQLQNDGQARTQRVIKQ